MKRTRQEAIWQAKCPCCREGDVFKYPLTVVTRFGSMNEKCPVCGTGFTPEPGFYFGALYISYGFTVVFFAGISLLLYFTIRPASWVYLTAIFGTSLFFIPFSFRYSRILFLYWFGGISYRGK
ncbi:MAG: DUF983 domain-containing protein [Cyclobacteriaceae bacterium]